MKEETKSTLIYTMAGIFLGILSASNGKNIILGGFILIFMLNLVISKLFGKKEFKWIVSNGIWPGLTTWFAVWVVLFNL
jgi:hypothetical protein